MLCHNCDYEVHSLPRNSDNHDRRPLEGFTGCPSVSEISATLGLEDIDAKCTIVDDDQSENNKSFFGGLFSGLYQENDEFTDLFWDAPTMVSLDELIVSTDKQHSFQAMVVPPLPKVSLLFLCFFYDFHFSLFCSLYGAFMNFILAYVII